MLTLICGIRPPPHAGAGALHCKARVVVGQRQSAGAGEGAVKLDGEARAVVLHHGQLVLQVGAHAVCDRAALAGGLKLFERGGQTRQRLLKSLRKFHVINT
jgi:hypothetical protein